VNNFSLIGLYEKALPAYFSWYERLSYTKCAGFDFLEISIDETDERLSRVFSTGQETEEINDAIKKSGIPILTMCLSGNRRFPIGSKDKEIRKKGIELIKGAILLAVEVGIRIIQLAGYDEYYNESDQLTQDLFYESLKECVDFTSRYSVMLAIETMDTDLMGSISNIMKYIRRINSPWLNIYPDIGNLSSRNVNIKEDFFEGREHIVAIHLKDTRKNEFRRVGFGEGVVDFQSFFKLLTEINYKGPFVVEMWSDDDLAYIVEVKKAREFLLAELNGSRPKQKDKVGQKHKV